MKTLIVAIASICLSVAAQFCLKAGVAGRTAGADVAGSGFLRGLWSTLTNSYVLGGLLLYGLGAIVWLSVLSKWDVSKAYPLVGLGFVLTAAVGFVLGEQVTVRRLGGVALICAGVVLVARS